MWGYKSFLPLSVRPCDAALIFILCAFMCRIIQAANDEEGGGGLIG